MLAVQKMQSWRFRPPSTRRIGNHDGQQIAIEVITAVEPAPTLEHVTELFVIVLGLASYWMLSPPESLERQASPVIEYPLGHVLVA